MSASSSEIAADATNPEIGITIEADGMRTNVHDQGTGDPLLLIHGSGPGVSAWANWRTVIPALSRQARVIAPDMAGFGYSESPDSSLICGDAGRLPAIWVRQALGVLDTLGIERADVVGNSFGGALALALAIRHPDRVRRLVLMGSVGVSFPLTPALDKIWGYTPSLENMLELLDIFAYDRSLVTDELAHLRYQASIRPGVQEAYATLFPAPRQRWIDALASDEASIRQLPHQTLILHGREDTVIPLAVSQQLAHWIPRSQLHVFGQCGHWTQIEHGTRFVRLVSDFLHEEADA
ncbi:Dihydrolipoamide acetyltransferase component (E2) of acetoin dehydrogenase complex OS=Castellaniella defragrans (strain DSM / CCUG 39792 / 65Phen) OX=1437824 GN=BN940_09176 PE=4 SV=1 [Castellaniella denitrificans]|uniref:alpha/beta fold hydrolase n=1 Tax=Castellaniella sp. TaxID=1955812 RepID=UPI002AFF2797|nr:alpha/beta hydrolase [Castellaniella sp.]